MTYIEFFDKTATENVATCLTRVPDRVIFIGDNGNRMRKHIEDYQRVFRARGYQVEMIIKTTSKSNLDRAVAMLTEIVQTYDDCVFDITGGEEIMSVALGMVVAQTPDKNIQIHRFNLGNNKIQDCDMDGQTVYLTPPTLSVEENIRIYGGDVIYGAVDDVKTYLWDLNEEFLQDVERIWQLCKDNIRGWNIQIGIFAAAELVGRVQADGLTTVVSRAALDRYLIGHNLRYKKLTGIIDDLLAEGLLTDFQDGDLNAITISYKDPQVKRCLTRAGQALEMKIFTTAKRLCNEDGTALYNDAMNGVFIDWDGESHDEDVDGLYDTENEVDVMLMYGIVPVFVSCKNGFVTQEELYKLNTIAHRFGGDHAKKVLVATSLDFMGESGYYLRQRASDMNIRIVDDAYIMDDDELENRLKNLWSN
ncbi:MAG: DUF1887 family protein [Ruminococcaceae bacterium]|nr:DUF1887 family protein [Oscillospiraceae bacterium]